MIIEDKHNSKVGHVTVLSFGKGIDF
ncbi:phosphoribosylaminoimidazole carboxylase [Streptococcus sanguinis]|uniref:Phosphoribosylaminoimidazole carboxylase n=1 Tax=Streptococcus sanguinis TaxID=1305 RepID=A0A3P1S871_STRSA|nr:phosphoribosylaminoimidazole carboxylase [Streptococcus sanguinis]